MVRVDVGVRHGVTDGPAGEAWVVVPDLREAALQLKRAYSTFWCSTWANGCGGELTLAAGDKNRPHFRHQPGEGANCRFATNPEGAERSYLHRVLQDVLKAWLAEQGYSCELEAYLDDGARADLLVRIDELRLTIEIQLSHLNVEVWTARNKRYARQVDGVRWLFGPQIPEWLPREDIRKSGMALRVDLARWLDGATPPDATSVIISTASHSGILGESPLSECTMTSDGIMTPFSDDAAAQHKAWLDKEEIARATRIAHSVLRGGPSQRGNSGARPIPRDLFDPPSEKPTTPRPIARGRELPRGYARGNFDNPWLPMRPGWEPDCGWGFLSELDESLHHACRYMAYIVCILEWSGPAASLSFSDIDDGRSIQEALVAAGLIELYDTPSGIQRWRRTPPPADASVVTDRSS